MGYIFKIVSVADNTMSAQAVVTVVKAHMAEGSSAVTNPTNTDFMLTDSANITVFTSVQVGITTPTVNGQRGEMVCA